MLRFSLYCFLIMPWDVVAWRKRKHMCFSLMVSVDQEFENSVCDYLRTKSFHECNHRLMVTVPMLDKNSSSRDSQSWSWCQQTCFLLNGDLSITLLVCPCQVAASLHQGEGSWELEGLKYLCPKLKSRACTFFIPFRSRSRPWFTGEGNYIAMIWFIGRNVETVYHIYQEESQYFPSYSVFCFEVVFYAWESTHFANWQLRFLYPIYPIIAKWTLLYYTWTFLCFDDKALQFSLVTLIYAGYGNAHLCFQNPKVISTGLCDMHSKFQVSLDCMRSYLRKLFIIVCAWCVCGHAHALSMGIHMYLPLCMHGGLKAIFFNWFSFHHGFLGFS